MKASLRSIFYRVAAKWCLTDAERRQLEEYLNGKRTSAEFDALPPTLRACADEIGSITILRKFRH